MVNAESRKNCRYALITSPYPHPPSSRPGNGTLVVLWSRPALVNCTDPATCTANSTLAFQSNAGQYKLTVAATMHITASGATATLSRDIWIGSEAPEYLVLLSDGNLIVMQPSTVVCPTFAQLCLPAQARPRHACLHIQVLWQTATRMRGRTETQAALCGVDTPSYASRTCRYTYNQKGTSYYSSPQ